MTSSRDILQQLLDTMENDVRRGEEDLEQFRRATIDFQQKSEIYIETRTREIDRDRKRFELFRAEMLAMQADETPSSQPQVPALVPISTGVIAPSDGQSETKRIQEAARIILRAADRPMMQSEIKAKMDEMNIVLESSNPIELIRAALRRLHSEFQLVKGKGWVLVKPFEK